MDLNQYLSSIAYIAVPLSRAPSGHLLLDVMVNGIDTRLILDTGASGTVFEITRNEKFNLELTLSEERATGIGGDVELNTAIVNNLIISDFVMNDVKVGFIDLRHVVSTFAMMGVEIDGVIGADVLIRGEAIMDYTNLIMYLRQHTPRRSNPSDLIAFIKSKNYIAIPVNQLSIGHKYLTTKINDVPSRIILDTGASHTVLDTDRFARFNLSSFSPTTSSCDGCGDCGTGGRGIGVGDEVTSGISLSVVNKFELSDEYILNDVSVALISIAQINRRLTEIGVEEFDGIIGADILANGEAIIDYKNLMLYLKRPSENISGELTDYLNTIGYTRITLSQKQMVELPFVEMKINGISGRFTITPTNNITNLDPSRADRFGIEIEDIDESIESGSALVNITISDDFIINEHQVIFSTIAANTMITRLGLEGIDGNLGVDILLEKHALLDFGNRALYLAQEPQDRDLSSILIQNGYEEISFILLSNGSIHLEAQINDIIGRFLVSFTSSRTVIEAEHYEKFGLETTELPGAMVSGGTAPRFTTARTLSIKEGISLNNFDMIVMNIDNTDNALTEEDGNIDGILGVNFLTRTEAIIDFAYQKIYIRR